MRKQKRHYAGSAADDFNAADLNYATRYFASAGSSYLTMERPQAMNWLPWAWGPELRDFWYAARDHVRRRVPSRAFELMEKYFDRQEAVQFENWPRDDRREVYELCERTGCLYWIDKHGNCLPLGDTVRRERN